MIELVVRGVVALERIAAVLEDVGRPASQRTEDPPACLHPADARVEFGGMGESDGFQCRACGEHVSPVPFGNR